MSKPDPISDDEHHPQPDESDGRIFLWIAAVLVLAIYVAVSVYNWTPWLDY